jgi:VWFA-related protein
MTRRAVVVLTALMASGGIGAHGTGQSQPVRPSDRQSYSSATTAILVDVVVRDRKGRPVTDMKAAEFSLYEDGTPQKIDTFTRVTRGGGIGVDVKWKRPGSTVAILPAGSLPPPLPGEEAANQSTTAFVFDHLSEEALELAQKATLQYVPMSGESDVRVGVFDTDFGMRVMQGYTTDRAAIRRAVSQIMPAGSSVADRKVERRDEIMERRRELQGEQLTMAAATAAGGAGRSLTTSGSRMGQAETELRLLEMERAMIDGFDALDRDHKGYDTTLALVRVIRSLAETPGRKSVVLFSEGLPVSPVLSARLDDLIDGANRSNVTVYAVDAKGLRTSSTSAETRKQLQEFTDDRMVENISGGSGGDQPMTRGLERVEDMVRLDSRTGLARLSQDTGGFLVEQSNDLTHAFKRIDEDNQFHYMLSYTPSNTVFDGKFREILVKSRRSDTQVFARKGYRATRMPGSSETASYEVPALAMLDRTPLPNAFPIRAQGFTFPDPDHPGLAPLVVRLTTDSLRFVVDAAKSTYSAQVAVVVRIKDSQGKDVHKLSQQYVLSGDVKDMDAAKRGTILFYREPLLAPGVYTVESIAFDALAGSGSARVSTLTVPAAESQALGLSSIVFVDHVEQISDAPDQTAHAAPFFVGQTLVYPNIGDPVMKSTTKELPFFFTIYRGASGPLTATAQLLRDGGVVAEAPLEIAASPEPRIQQLARFPVSGLAPGTYQLRIIVASGQQHVAESAYFTLQEG